MWHYRHARAQHVNQILISKQRDIQGSCNYFVLFILLEAQDSTTHLQNGKQATHLFVTQSEFVKGLVTPLQNNMQQISHLGQAYHDVILYNKKNVIPQRNHPWSCFELQICGHNTLWYNHPNQPKRFQTSGTVWILFLFSFPPWFSLN